MTNHMRVLLAVAEQPRQSLSEIAARTGLDVRHIRRLLDDLEASGYLSRQREERPNRYTVHVEAPLRQRGLSGMVGGLLEAVRDAR